MRIAYRLMWETQAHATCTSTQPGGVIVQHPRGKFSPNFADFAVRLSASAARIENPLPPAAHRRAVLGNAATISRSSATHVWPLVGSTKRHGHRYSRA